MNIKTQTPHEVFRGLADPVRLRIAVMLTRGERCVCDIQGVLGLPQSTVSRQLGQMRLVGLVVDRRAGKWVYYRLADLGVEMRAVLERLAQTEPYAEDGRRLVEGVAAKGC